MAKKEATIQRWIGLSTETKPTTAADGKVPIGATFYEYDTKNWYKCYDGTNWTILALDYGLAFGGTCNAGMTASTTVIDCADLAGYGNDYFNTQFYMQVVKNANSIGGAPDSEIRKITDYVSASTTPGRFTVDAFSANVEASDEIYILHKSIMLILTELPTAGDWALADYDLFNVADADADNERWNPEYISGAAGGEADIDTTTSDKLYILADYNVGGALRYAVSHNLPFYADFMKVEEDVTCTFGVTDGATAKAVGIGVSAGAAYDANNYIFIERQKGTAVDRIQVRSNLNGAGEATTNVAITDDSVGFKIERLGQTWAVYYSTVQMEEGAWDWVKAAEIEDPSNYMTNEYTFYQECFNGSAGDATETAAGDFDNFYYWLGTGGGSQYIAGDYSSAWVSNDRDGNVFERQEAIQNVINIGAASTLTSYEEDGSGANVFNTLIAVQGVTTAAGTTTTVVSTARTEGADYWNGHLIAMIEGANIGQVRVIVDDDGSGTLTIRPALIAASGDTNDYIIFKDFETPIPGVDSTDNYQMRDVIGQKADTMAAMNTAPVDTDSIVTVVKNIMERVGVTPADPDDSLHTIIGQRDATADTTAGTASHSALWNAAVAGLGLVDGGAEGFEADGTGVNLYDVLVAHEGLTTGAGDTTSIIDTGLGGWAADNLNGLQVLITSGAAEGLVRTIVDFDGTSDLTVEPAMFVAVGSAETYIITSNKSADWICGDNNASNAYDSSAVTADGAGSILERLEYIQGMLVVGEGTFTTGSAIEPIDTGRAEGDNYWNGCLLMPLTGDVSFQPRLIVDWDNGTTKFYVDPNQPFTAATGTVAYVILAYQGALAPAADQTESYTVMDVVGNKTDAVPAMDAAIAAADTIVDHVKAIRERLGATPNDTDDPLHLIHGQRDDAAATGPTTGAEGVVELLRQAIQQSFLTGLAKPFQVTDATSTTVFASTSLIGCGEDAFPAPWACYVMQSDNAAPEGELRLVDDFVDATGTVTVSVAYTVAPDVGDWLILLHPSIAMLGDTTTAAAAGAVTTTDYLMAYIKQLVNIFQLADADLSDILDDSPFAHIFAQDSDVSAFNDHTMSLEALANHSIALRGPIDSGSSTTVHIVGNLKGFGDNYFNDEWFLLCSFDAADAAAAPQGEIRQITDYTSSSGTFTTTAFTAVAETGDLMVAIHRSNIGLLNAIHDITDVVDMSAYIHDHSILANMLSSDGDISGYDRQTDSQEAIRDALDAAATVIDTIDANTEALYAVADGDLSEIIDDSILAQIMAIDGNADDNYDDNTMSLQALNVDLDAIIVDTTLLYTTADADLSEMADDSYIAMLMAQDGDVSEYNDHIMSLEAISYKGLSFKGKITTGASTTAHAIAQLIGFGDNFFNDEWFMYVSWDQGDAAAAPQGEVRQITDYATATGTFTTTAFTVATVNDDIVAIVHRSILGTLGVIHDITDPVDMTVYVPDNSVESNKLTIEGDTSDYDRRTDSQEAISGAIAAHAGAELALHTIDNDGTLVNGAAEATLCALDAAAGTCRGVKVHMALDAACAGNITPAWYVTSYDTPTTFVLRAYPVTSAAHTPGAATNESYEFGDLPAMMQLEFRVICAGADVGVNHRTQLTYEQ